MRVSLQPAYILHSRPYRDTSVLLEAFTAEQGRISLVGKGAKRRARGGSSAALLQPFTPLLVSFSGRAEMKTLTQVEPAGGAIPLRGERMYSGLYINELLVRLLHRHDPHPALFAIYGEALGALASDAVVDATLRRFEYRLLQDMGYSFELGVDGHSGELLREDALYHYNPDYGLVESLGAVKAGQPSYSGKDLLQLSRGDFEGGARLCAKRLMRQALAVHLGDTPLRSRELFRTRRRAGEVKQ